MPYTRDDCLNALQATINELGHVPTMNEYDDVGDGPCASTVATHCGNWQQALDELDANPRPRNRYTKQDCIKALQEAAEELGEEPTQHSYQRLDIHPSAATIQARFSSWKAAKAEADVIAWSVRNEA